MRGYRKNTPSLNLGVFGVSSMGEANNLLRVGVFCADDIGIVQSLVLDCLIYHRTAHRTT